MFKNYFLAALALLIYSQALSSASPHSSIAELDNHDRFIHYINIEISNDPNFLVCRLNVGGQIFEISANENFHTLAKPIAASTELQKLPILPTSLALYSPCVDPLQRWLVNTARGVEFMDPDPNVDLILQAASNGIVIQAVVFQRTILLPNLGQLDQLLPAEKKDEKTVYKWSEIKHLVFLRGSLERALAPVAVQGEDLESAFNTGMLNLKLTQNYLTNTGCIVPVFAHQTYEAPFISHNCINPMYYILVDDSDFHMYKIDKPAGCASPAGHNIYPRKLQVVGE